MKSAWVGLLCWITKTWKEEVHSGHHITTTKYSIFVQIDGFFFTYVYLWSISRILLSPQEVPLSPFLDNTHSPTKHLDFYHHILVLPVLKLDVIESWICTVYFWLLPLSVMVLRCTCVALCIVFSFFYCCVVFLCMEIPKFVLLFPYWWAFGLSPVFGYYEWSHYEHLYGYMGYFLGINT